MKRLLNIEYRILSKYTTFNVLFLLYFIFLALVAYGFGNFLSDLTINSDGEPVQFNLGALPIYRFPDIWHNMAYIASYFKFLLAILIIMVISNEFEYRTLRQHIIDGMTRSEFVNSKFLSIGIISSLASLFVLLVILALGISNDESGNGISRIHEGSVFIVGFFVQMFAFMSFAFLIATYFKRTGLSVIILLLWVFIVENIISYKLPDDFGNLLPVKSMNELIQIPFLKYVNVGQSVQTTIDIGMFAVPIAWTVVFYLLITWMLNKRDL
ncbi:MAG: ABC transporter permease subunit [Bacteroidia bacterium]|nr:ABC transporter permease subunit [Bacteroidia bacterium]